MKAPDYYAMSRRAGRYEWVRAFRADLPGYLAGIIAGPILLVGVAIATLIGAPAP
jgi:hypothetical protein